MKVVFPGKLITSNVFWNDSRSVIKMEFCYYLCCPILSRAMEMEQ